MRNVVAKERLTTRRGDADVAVIGVLGDDRVAFAARLLAIERDLTGLDGGSSDGKGDERDEFH